MTYNEFKFCCRMFFVKYRKLRMCDIIKDNKILTVNSSIDDIIFWNNNCYGASGESIFYFRHKCINLNGYGHIKNFEKYKFQNCEDFLNYFKIPFEDIV